MPKTFISLVGQKVYLKVREEFLDPDRRLAANHRRRRQLALEAVLLPHLSLETIYRNNIEKPSVFNDDVMVMTHLFF